MSAWHGAALALLALFTACEVRTPEDFGLNCETDADCTGRQVCVDEWGPCQEPFGPVCTLPCEDYADCPTPATGYDDWPYCDESGFCDTEGACL